MKRSAIVLVAALALAGCQPKPDLTASPETMALACSSALFGYALWEASAAPNTKPATAVKIRAGFASVQAVCANPPSNNAEAILAAIAAVRAWQAEIERART